MNDWPEYVKLRIPAVSDNTNHLERYTLLDHSGIIRYETIGELIHTFKHQVHGKELQTGTSKKILLVMIEMLENIMKHSECCNGNNSEPSNGYLPVFSIRKDDNQFVIQSSNPIRKQSIPVFKNKLEYLNTLDPQGLKEFYKETITNGEFTNRGGAGLGLIEMAKISGNKIVYDFKPIDDHCELFSMVITIEETSVNL